MRSLPRSAADVICAELPTTAIHATSPRNTRIEIASSALTTFLFLPAPHCRPDRFDASALFILCGNVVVLHAVNRRGSLGFSDGLQGWTLCLIDVLFGPRQLEYDTCDRALAPNLKDWSQILALFGLGAAAIQTLRIH